MAAKDAKPSTRKNRRVTEPRDHVIAIASALPEVTLEDQGEHRGFRVRGRRFAWYLEDHHGDRRVALTCRAALGLNQTLADSRPDRYFLPKYVAHHGWVGLWLDVTPVDWDEASELILDSYRLIAPKGLVSLLD